MILSNDLIRTISKVKNENRALKSTQHILGSAIPEKTYRDVFPHTITIGNVANVTYAPFHGTLEAHAVDIDTMQAGLFTVNMQFKFVSSNWDNPIPPYEAYAQSYCEERHCITQLSDDGKLQMMFLLTNAGSLVGEAGQQHGTMVTQSFNVSLISVGNVAFIIDRVYGTITYNIIYQSQGSQQTHNVDISR